MKDELERAITGNFGIEKPKAIDMRKKSVQSVNTMKRLSKVGNDLRRGSWLSSNDQKKHVTQELIMEEKESSLTTSSESSDSQSLGDNTAKPPNIKKS